MNLHSLPMRWLSVGLDLNRVSLEIHPKTKRISQFSSFPRVVIAKPYIS